MRTSGRFSRSQWLHRLTSNALLLLLHFFLSLFSPFLFQFLQFLFPVYASAVSLPSPFWNRFFLHLLLPFLIFFFPQCFLFTAFFLSFLFLFLFLRFLLFLNFMKLWLTLLCQNSFTLWTLSHTLCLFNRYLSHRSSSC